MSVTRHAWLLLAAGAASFRAPTLRPLSAAVLHHAGLVTPGTKEDAEPEAKADDAPAAQQPSAPAAATEG